MHIIFFKHFRCLTKQTHKPKKQSVPKLLSNSNKIDNSNLEMY